jgi:hypothetical protein
MKSLFLVILLTVFGYYAYQHYATQPPVPLKEMAPTPQVRLSPEGTYFVVQPFSVTHEHGIHGFPAGKKVTLVRKDGPDFIVTDGTMEGRAPAEAFTNDLDQAEQLQTDASRQHNAMIQARQQHERQKARELVEQSQAMAAQATDQKEKALQNQVGRTEVALRNLQDRIAAAQSERFQKGYPSDGGPRYNQDGRSVFLSQDAVNIRQLLDERTKLNESLRLQQLALEEFRRAKN